MSRLAISSTRQHAAEHAVVPKVTMYQRRRSVQPSKRQNRPPDRRMDILHLVRKRFVGGIVGRDYSATIWMRERVNQGETL